MHNKFDKDFERLKARRVEKIAFKAEIDQSEIVQPSFIDMNGIPPKIQTTENDVKDVKNVGV